MSECGSIFLSANVPEMGQEGHDTIDTYFFRMAVIEFIDVVLGRKTIIMRVHQIITPMMTFMSGKYQLDFNKHVKLYQSKYTTERFPNDNEYFESVIEVENDKNDEKASLRKLHERMFTENDFSAAVFIGGSEFLREEIELFKELNPEAKRVIIPSPGGVAKELFKEQNVIPLEMEYSIDYIDLYCKFLNIDYWQQRNGATIDQKEEIEAPEVELVTSSDLVVQGNNWDNIVDRNNSSYEWHFQEINDNSFIFHVLPNVDRDNWENFVNQSLPVLGKQYNLKIHKQSVQFSLSIHHKSGSESTDMFMLIIQPIKRPTRLAVAKNKTQDA